MTNLERFQHWTRHLFSPQSFVDFGWYFCVGAALQRRVWYGNIDGDPLFPNPYIIMVGDAGVGKGLVLGKVSELMKHHTYANENPVDKVINRKFLFPPGPDDVTYEKLCEKLAKSTQIHRHINGEGKKCAYAHASMCFVLEELKSLFKKRHDDALNTLLLKTYDCKDHDYETKHQGESLIRKPCLAMLAGCTPDFLPKGVAQGILEDGTVSRMIFIYEWEPRMSHFFLGQPGESERVARDELLEHIKILSGLYGEVRLASDVEAFLEDWFKSEWKAKMRRCHPKMRTYYARSRVHVLKLGMAIHFSEKFDMVLSVEDCQKALALLDSIEPKMTLLLSSAGRNENYKITKDILGYLQSSPEGGCSLAELLIQYQTELDLDGLRSVLEDLRIMGKIIEQDGRYSIK